MSKLVGNFIIKDLVLQQNKRSYHQTARLHPDPGQPIQIYCQIISKPPFIPTLFDNYQKLHSISNRNVIKYVEFKETENNYYIFLEQFNQGTLADLIEKEYINEDQAKFNLRQILNGLKALHENQITFADLSPKSIVKSNDEIKIGQINLCVDQVSFMQSNEDFDRFDLVKEIIAPEILQGKTKGSMISDLFSTSVIYYKMLFKRYPFNGSNKNELIAEMQKNEINFTINHLDVSEESIDFLRKTLKFEPQDRLRLTEVYSHPLLKLLNISNTHMAQSTLLSISISKMMTISDLNVVPFDISNHKQFYQIMEQNNENEKKIDKFQPEQSQYLTKDNISIDSEDMKQFENSIKVTTEVFKEQRKALFRKQIDYYLEQRNIYSSLLETLSYVRLLDSEFQSVPLQFTLLKSIYLISNSLKTQMGELQLITNKIELIDEILASNFTILKTKIDAENEIIVQQWKQGYKQAEQSKERALKKGRLDEKQALIINESPQLALFEQMKDQIKQFIEKSSQFKITQNNPQLQQQINLQAVFSMMLVISYLLKWTPKQILQKQPLEYQDFIKRQNANELQKECQEKLKQLDGAFDKIRNAK